MTQGRSLWPSRSGTFSSRARARAKAVSFCIALTIRRSKNAKQASFATRCKVSRRGGLSQRRPVAASQVCVIVAEFGDRARCAMGDKPRQGCRYRFAKPRFGRQVRAKYLDETEIGVREGLCVQQALRHVLDLFGERIAHI